MNIHCIFSKAFSEIQIRVLSLSNQGQAILVLIGTVISTQGSASDPHALDAERFTGRVIFVGHLYAVAVGSRKQQTIGIVGVVHVLSAGLTSQFPHTGQAEASYSKPQAPDSPKPGE